MAGSAQVGLANIRTAMSRIRQHAHLTPMLSSSTIDRATGRTILFKCENMQRTGGLFALSTRATGIFF